jgi:tetratricopeptide (TPR) repeat protein
MRMSEETANCTICKQPLGENGRCQHCDGETPHIWTIQDWRPLLTLSLVIALGFSFTSLVVSSFDEKQNALAAEYSAAGRRVMDEWTRGARKYRPTPAVDAFETALVYSRNNFQYRLELTDALLATGATDEALAQLQGFLEQRPRDALVNLKLARLECHRKHADDALRYYQAAIEGVWPEHSDPVPQRIGVRFELAEYLLAQGRREQAEAELQSLAGVLPASRPEQEKLAGLYLRNGDAGRALSVYQAQLSANKNDATAILGAAQASFAAGNYATARHYLEELKPETSESRALLAELERMEALDPFARSATERIRTERTMAAFRIAVERLAGCGVPFAEAMTDTAKGAKPADPAQWSGFAKWAEQLSPMMSEHKLRGRGDVIESTMRFAFQAEMAAQKNCGTPTLNDEALLLLARERMGASQ